jgi:hypothetical protein
VEYARRRRRRSSANRRARRVVALGVAAVGAAAALATLASLAEAFTWPWDVGAPWPRSSRLPVETLDHPTLEARAATLSPGADAGFRFVVFGDQRALADGEWQALLRDVARRAAADDRILFLLDTGDIVHDGAFRDQFRLLRSILSPVRRLPYLVAVGNHETHWNGPGPARANTAAFLRYLDTAFSTRRMYYRKDVGPLRLFFLDTNDLVYGDDGGAGDAHRGRGAPRGAGEAPPRAPGRRAREQLAWLARELAEDDPGRTTVVVMHHPIVQSSAKHIEQARDLWNLRHEGRALADLLADGGVDVVLTGHTHTYERFTLRRADGRSLQVVNVSGRPRDSALWHGAEARKARPIAGREHAWLSARGWRGLDRWGVTQDEAMLGRGSNQYGLVTVGADGSLSLEMEFLDRTAAGVPPRGAVRLAQPASAAR